MSANDVPRFLANPTRSALITLVTLACGLLLTTPPAAAGSGAHGLAAGLSPSTVTVHPITPPAAPRVERPRRAFVVSVEHDGEWVEAGSLPANRFFVARSLDLSPWQGQGETRLRIVPRNGGLAHLDAVALAGAPPISASGISRAKIESADFDVVEVPADGLELSFGGGGAQPALLELTARIEPKVIGKVPFQFPTSNTHHTPSTQSAFYSYRLASVPGSLTIDGDIDDEALGEPFFAESYPCDSGHPQGATYGWVKNDQDTLYVALDFTPDNTMDGDKDYATVFVERGGELLEHRVTASDRRWGRTGFGYTERVAYQHKTYELALPLADLVAPGSDHVRLAFAAYGTASAGASRSEILAFDETSGTYAACYYNAGIGYDLKTQLFDESGAAIGSPVTLAALATAPRMAVAADPLTEAFLVVWHDSFSDRIMGRRVFPGGTTDAAATEISDVATGDDPDMPRLAFDTERQRYLVVWTDLRDGASARHVYGRFVGSDGAPQGAGSFAIETAENVNRWSLSIAFNPTDDQFLVTWEGDDGDLNAWRLDATDGSVIGSSFELQSAAAYLQYAAAAYNAVDGSYLVAFKKTNSLVAARRVQPDGTVGSEQLLFLGSGFEEPRVAAHPTVARFLVATGTSSNPVLGRWANAADGSAVGNEHVLSPAGISRLGNVGVASNPNNHSIAATTYDSVSSGPLLMLANGICVTGDPATTTEAGVTASLGISLCAAPSADVVIDVASADTGEGTVSPSQLTFQTTDWSDEQNVTVTGVRDGVADGDVSYLVTLTVDDSASPDDYDGIIDAALITNLDVGDLEWTGAGDGVTVYDEANWYDTSSGSAPPAGTVDPSTDVDRVMSVAFGIPGGASGAAADLQLGEHGDLRISGATVWRMDLVAARIRAADPGEGDVTNRPVSVADTAELLTDFLLDIDLDLSGSATVTFNDGDDPLERSTVSVDGYDVTLNFLNETPADFVSEHESKITVNGSAAELGTNPAVWEAGDNLVAVSDGASGCIVTALPLWADLEWTGAVDDDVYNENNWNDTSTLSAPSADTVNPSTDVDLVMNVPSGTPGGTGGADPDFYLGAAGSLSISGASVWRMDLNQNAGIRARDSAQGNVEPNRPLTVADTAELLTHRIVDIDLAASGSATITLKGGGNPMERSTVAVTGYDVTLNFMNETPADFAAEHVGKVTVNGAPPVLGIEPAVWEAGDNLVAVSDGASGCIVTAPYLGIYVDEGSNIVADDGSCSLPEAIANANADSRLYSSAGECEGGTSIDTIYLETDVSLEVVSSSNADGTNGTPGVTGEIILEGNGYTISRDLAAADFRFFYLNDAAAELSLRDLTLDNGNAGTFNGGAVFIAAGKITAHDVTFSNNQATHGGAIYRSGSSELTVDNSRFISNQASTFGGAVFLNCCDSGTKTIINSLFDGNIAGDQGGALVGNANNSYVVNSTFVNNSADKGGGISFSLGRPVSLFSSTITNNTADQGGGLYAWSPSATLPELYNNIISGNTATTSGNDCAGVALDQIDARNNVFGTNGNDQGCTGFAAGSVNNVIAAGALSTIFEVDASGLPLLQDNGGLTETVALEPGSPAFDIGDPLLLPDETTLGVDGDGDSFVDDPIDYDQRADDATWPRNAFSNPDAGAYELATLPIYVDIDATSGNDDGSSWDDAYLTLQAALAAATDGDRVWIAAGVYYPASTFSIANGVRVYGGFAGTEVQLSERNVTNNVVVLSGDVDFNDTNIDGNFIAETYDDWQGTNTGPVVTLGSSVILDGVTVTAGFTVASDGGGIKCVGGTDPILRYLVVSGNQASDNGGGVSECDQAVVESSLITGNYSDNNGGGWSGGGTFRDVVFSDNEANGYGGAVVGIGSNSLDMTRCTVVGNSGSAIDTGVSLTMDTVLVSGNSGTAILIDADSASLNNVTVTGNSTGLSASGGVHFLDTVGTAAISNSIIWNNANLSGTGTLTSAIDNESGSTVTVSNSIVQGSGGSAAWVPTDLDDGGNNKDENPQFVIPVNPADAPTAGGNSHLPSGSPAVDAGDNSHVTTITDLDGEARIQNGTVDMGVYEQLVADLAISKTDGVTAAVPGDSITYTLVASNSGPSYAGGAEGVEVNDLFPTALTCTWTGSGTGGASGPASGSGDIDEEVVNLPSGSSFTFVAECDINPTATGTLSNTATIDSYLMNDPPGNNSATDNDTVLVPTADLSITKTDGVTTAVPGDSITYTIVASNAGPSEVIPEVEDLFPDELTGCQWTCASADADCISGPVAGDIVTTAEMPPSSSVTYTAICTIDPSASGTLSNTATISSAATDPVPGNNSATDNNTVLCVGAAAAPFRVDPLPCVGSELRIGWDPVAGATGYDLRVDGTTVITDVTSPYTYDPGDIGLHGYEVRAKSAACGDGPWSPSTEIGCLVAVNDFTAADNDRWFNDLNWSGGHVPMSAEDAAISALAAYAYAGEGATLQCDDLRVGSYDVPGTASLYSELPIETASWLYVGNAAAIAGHFVGNLTVAGADVTAGDEVSIAYITGAGRSGEGHVAITDGSLIVAETLYVGYVGSGAGDGTGSLTVTNGDIHVGNELYVGELNSSPGFIDGSLRLENGRLDVLAYAYIGDASGGSGGSAATMTLIRAEAYGDGDVEFADCGNNDKCSSLLTLDNAFFEAAYYWFGSASTTRFHVDGVQRVSAGNVNGPDQYSAMDLSDVYGTQYGVVINQGATLQVHFGYTPSVGDTYDLIKLKVGQTFNGGSFDSVVPVGLGSSLAVIDEIVPGDAVNGEIVRVTVIEALFGDGFESGDTTGWSNSVP